MYRVLNDHSLTATYFNNFSPARTIRNNNAGLGFVVFIFLFFVIHFPGISISAQLNLPKDANGWTIFTPSTDTRIVYVSSTGNDSTGKVYSATSPELESSPFIPSGTIQPFATFSAAFANTREGYPDWILVKRGDVFLGNIDFKNRNGRSTTEPFFIGAYGDSGASPIFKTGSEPGFRSNSYKRYFAISGIDFYAHTRDPESPDYTGIAGWEGISINGGPTTKTEAILIEGCKFRYFANNCALDFYNNGGGIIIRRCLFLSSYSGGGHSQGILASNINDGIILEENIFDHNGWLVQDDSDGTFEAGEATMFNHNAYIAEVKEATVRNNILLRPSSINLKFTGNYDAGSVGPFTVLNNLTVDGEIGITVAGANNPLPLRVAGATVSENVITNLNRSRPRNQDLGRGIDLLDLDGGIISNNYIIHSDVSNSRAIGHQGTSRNVSIIGNVVYSFKNVTAVFNLDSSYGSNVENMLFANNRLQVPQSSGYTIYSPYDPAGKWTFSSNKYYSDKTDGARFRLNGVNITDVQWASATGDNSTFEQVSFPDPTRSIETYMHSLGEPATIDAFIAKCRTQDRYNWDDRFTAERVNAWIKLGFGLLGPANPAGFKMVTN